MEQVRNIPDNVMMTPIRGIIPRDNGAPRKPRIDPTDTVNVTIQNLSITKKLNF